MKIYVIERQILPAVNGGHATWLTVGGGWSDERPDAEEWPTQRAAVNALNAYAKRRPVGWAWTKIVEEIKEDA